MRDLLSLTSQDTNLKKAANTNGGEYVGSCPFCGGDDRFNVWPDHPDGAQFWCRKCERWGDAIAYAVEHGDITPGEAGRLRHADDPPQTHHRASQRRAQRETVKAPVKISTEAPSAAWREMAARFADYCAAALWEGDNPGLEHLHGRGLTDDTIRAWGLGWHGKARRRPSGKWGLDGKPVYLARGITIPWHVESEVWHVKTRLFEDWGDDTPKYIRVRGGEPILYGLDRLAGKGTVVICEGELDAALLWQEAGDLVDVVAVGTKTQRLNPKALAHLTGASRWLVALDSDADDKADQWERWSARVTRIRPLNGNDVTDFHNEGGDLRAWIEYHLSKAKKTAPGSGAMDLEAEAARLLDSGMASRADRRRYSEIAEALGWPCFGMDWPEWARLPAVGG